MRYVLRHATDEDKEWLAQLRREAYRELFDKTWGSWDEERHQRHFCASWGRGHISVIEVDGNQIGMIQLLKKSGLIEIKEIQIHPKYQGQGYGSQVLREVSQQSRADKKDVILSLGLKNEGALRLYKRLGFRETERSDTHIHMKLIK